jgi:hypothetical protein
MTGESPGMTVINLIERVRRASVTVALECAGASRALWRCPTTTVSSSPPAASAMHAQSSRAEPTAQASAQASQTHCGVEQMASVLECVNHATARQRLSFLPVLLSEHVEAGHDFGWSCGFAVAQGQRGYVNILNIYTIFTDPCSGTPARSRVSPGPRSLRSCP